MSISKVVEKDKVGKEKKRKLLKDIEIVDICRHQGTIWTS